MRYLHLSLFFLTLALFTVLCQDPADLVADLPNYPYKSRLYSGYLSLDDPLKKYHYVFIEATQDLYNAPLVLWLNGGPGCSSLLGWITENGPAIFKGSDDTLSINEYSWNKLANIVYLELVMLGLVILIRLCLQRHILMMRYQQMRTSRH